MENENIAPGYVPLAPGSGPASRPASGPVSPDTGPGNGPGVTARRAASDGSTPERRLNESVDAAADERPLGRPARVVWSLRTVAAAAVTAVALAGTGGAALAATTAGSGSGGPGGAGMHGFTGMNGQAPGQFQGQPGSQFQGQVQGQVPGQGPQSSSGPVLLQGKQHRPAFGPVRLLPYSTAPEGESSGRPEPTP